jgi:hypothetical protein
MSVTFSLATTPSASANDDYAAEVNFSNSNARVVLRALGLESEELYGDARCGALLAACDGAIGALHSDPGADRGRFGVVSRGAGGCTVIECGEESGSLLRRLRAVRDLAERGGALGRVVWG